MKSAILVAAALWAIPQPAITSRTHPLVGEWRITFPWHMELHNGVVRADMETGKLTVELRGDSLVATLVRDPAPQPPRRREIRLSAPIGSGEAVFVLRDRVTFNAGGERREATAVTTWVLRADGDQLGGTLERRLEGEGGTGLGPQPLAGHRVRR